MSIASKQPPGLYHTLVDKKKSRDLVAIPLVSSFLSTSIVDLSASHTLTQVFSNKVDESINEAFYTFPLYESCAITSFRAKIGEVMVKGVVKEKSEARQEYEEAKDRGEEAALLEQDKADVFTTRVGNIPKQTEVVVVIKYVHELKQDIDAEGIRLVIPKEIGERYGSPPTNLALTARFWTPEWWHDLEMPSFLSGFMREQGGGFSSIVNFTMSGKIMSVRSPSHASTQITVGTHEGSGDEYSPNKMSASYNASSFLQREFVLIVASENLNKPRAFFAKHPTLQATAVMCLTLVPQFSLQQQQPEVVFVIDRSASMSGHSIEIAKKGLMLFLTSLPVGSRFNICSFGSSYSYLWAKSRIYNAENLASAKVHVSAMSADMGGTEIWSPVQETMKRRMKDLNLEILLLTDGQIWQYDEMLEKVGQASRNDSVRLFTLGIGGQTSHAVLESLARAGRGYAQHASDGASINKKVMRMLNAALTPHMNEWQLEWDGKKTSDFAVSVEVEAEAPPWVNTDDTAVEPVLMDICDMNADPDHPPPAVAGKEIPSVVWPQVLQIPAKLPPLYSYSRFTAFLHITGEMASNPPDRLTLSADVQDAMGASGKSPSRLTLDIPVQILQKNSGLWKLAGRRLLQDLEEGRADTYDVLTQAINPIEKPSHWEDLVSREGAKLGVEFGLVSKWTSFIATRKRISSEPAKKPTARNSRGKTKNMQSSRQLRSRGPPSDIADDMDLVEPDEYEKETADGGIGLSAEEALLPINFSARVPIAAAPSHQTGSKGRTRQTARRSTGGKAARKQLASKAPRMSSNPIPPPVRPSYGLGKGGAWRHRKIMGSPNPPTRTSSRTKRAVASPTFQAINTAVPPTASSGEGKESKDKEMAKMKMPITTEDILSFLAMEQRFDGSYGDDEMLQMVVLGNKNAYDKSLCANRELWITILVVVFLEKKLKEFEEEWELMGNKAMNWISKCGSGDVDAVWVEAKCLIK